MFYRITLPVSLLALFFTLVQPVQAQREQRFRAGIIAGLTASQIDGDESYGYNKLGLQAGVRAAAILNKRAESSIELLFAQRGARNELIPNNINPNNFSLTLNYVEVPLQFHYKDWFVDDDEDGFYRVVVNGGLSYGRLINFRVSDDLSFIEVVAPYVNKNDFNYLLGATIYANRHLGFTIRASRGIGFIYNPAKWDTPPSARKWYSHALYFQAVYML
jgi:hypothetical protein